MNEFDMYGQDYTGFGPTGSGNAATAAERRRMMSSQYHTTNVGRALVASDPYIMNMSRLMMQATSAFVDPAEARRRLWQTHGGQFARDAALMMRRSGLLGYGDPINTAANFMQGVAGGGFTASFIGQDGGSIYGSGQRVTGNGALSERVATSYARSVMDNIYGSGSRDPSRARGFDMEEVSSVFRNVARRSGLGNTVRVVQNASTRDKVLAARESEYNPEVLKALNEFKPSGVEGADSAALLEFAEKQKDPAVQDSLRKLSQASTAAFVDKNGARQISKVIDSITEGMASLADIYGELNGPQLQQKLEAITGIRITSSAQGHRARDIVDSLRGAAQASGMDPRAYMEMSVGLQTSHLQSVMGRAEYGAHNASQAKLVAASEHSALMNIAANRASTSVAASGAAKAMGIDLPSVDQTELYAEAAAGLNWAAENYTAMSYSYAGLENLPQQYRERAAVLQERFTQTGISESERMSVEREMQGLFSDAYGGKSFSAVSAGIGAHLNAIRESDGEKSDSWVKAADLIRNSGRNTSLVAGSMRGYGVDNAAEVASMAVLDIGAAKLPQLAEIANDSMLSDTDRRAALLSKLVNEGGLDADKSEMFVDSMFDSSGKIRNPEAYRDLIQQTGIATMAMGYSSTMTQRDDAEAELGRLFSGDTRKKLMTGGSALRDIVTTAVQSGSRSLLNDPESVALMLASSPDLLTGEMPELNAFGEPTGKTKNIRDYIATGVDMSGGMTAETMAQLSKLSDGETDNLWSQITDKNGKSFETAEDFYAATSKDPDVRIKAMKALKAMSDKGKFRMSGGQDSLSFINTEMLDSVRPQMNRITENMSAAAILMQDSKLSDGASSRLWDSAVAGGDLDLSQYSPGLLRSSDIKNRGELDSGRARQVSLAKILAGGDKDTISTLLSADKGGVMLKELGGTLEMLKDPMFKGIGNLSYRDSSGEMQGKSTAELIKLFQEAVDNLKNGGKSGGGGDGGQVMEVASLTVTGKFDATRATT